MANILTGIRILCALLILISPVFSKWYYFLYLLGGFTDAIDGTVARKTKKTSSFGSKFDTIADFVFTLSVSFKIIPLLSIPKWLLVWILIIAILKITFHIVGYIKYQKLKTVHSLLNKICGVIVFIIPLVIRIEYLWQNKIIIIILVCVFTFVASIYEGITIIKYN